MTPPASPRKRVLPPRHAIAPVSTGQGDRREGAGALRPPVYVRKEIVPTSTSTTLEKRARRSLSTRPSRCPGRDRRLLRPRRSRGARGSPLARAEDHRRHLPPGDHAPRGRRFATHDYAHPAHWPRGHEEVDVGTSGEAPSTSPSSKARRRRPHHRPRPEKVVWLSQTTLSVDETMETVRRLRERASRRCRTRQRRHLLRHPEPPARGEADGQDCDLMIVVGSATPPTRFASSRSPSSTVLVRDISSTMRTRSTRPGSTMSRSWASPRVRRCPKFSSGVLDFLAGRG